ncbi:phosphodiesterase [Variovorax sp. VNK109]|uniref:phosphodiesterase n=1 Tax=Variovorax sp. VNK109 TaxID=3400919 RepID=UPI003C0E4987
MPKSLLIAQLSDGHLGTGADFLGGRIDTRLALRQAVAHVRGLDPLPDVVLYTGDLGERGNAQEYEAIAAELAPLSMPVYAVPGNHDAPIVARHALGACMPVGPDAPDGACCYHVQHEGLHLIALDTVVPRSSHGALDAARLDWLAGVLGTCRGEPVLLFMHHPPLPTGIEVMDACSLMEGVEPLAALIRAHGHVQGVLCGHLHRPVQMTFAGVPLHVAPSIAHQIQLDLRPGAPLRARLEPPKISLHRWTPALGLCTHLSYTGDFGEGLPL